MPNEEITNFMAAGRNRPEALSLLPPLTDLPDLFWCLVVVKVSWVRNNVNRLSETRLKRRRGGDNQPEEGEGRREDGGEGKGRGRDRRERARAPQIGPANAKGSTFCHGSIHMGSSQPPKFFCS